LSGPVPYCQRMPMTPEALNHSAGPAKSPAYRKANG